MTSQIDNWTIHHKAVTESTNLDARDGQPGDVFVADAQTAGRGSKWILKCILPGSGRISGRQDASAGSCPVCKGMVLTKKAPAAKRSRQSKMTILSSPIRTETASAVNTVGSGISPDHAYLCGPLADCHRR